jgi:tetratricopeptide (TPR) repeat protein
VPLAVARCQELREASGEDRVVRAAVERCLAALAAMAGRFDEARRLERQSSAVLDGVGMMTPSWVSRMIVADAREFTGDRAGAERELEAQRAYYDGIHELDAHAINAAFRLANLRCDGGRFDSAAECLADYHHFPGAVNPPADTYRLAARARIAAHRGELAEASTLARDAGEAADRVDLLNQRAHIWLGVAEAHRTAGETAEADAALARAVELYEQKGNISAVRRLVAAVA